MTDKASGNSNGGHHAHAATVAAAREGNEVVEDTYTTSGHTEATISPAQTDSNTKTGTSSASQPEVLANVEVGGDAAHRKSVSAPGWGFLKHPRQEDMRGPRKSRRLISTPPPAFRHLLVMDFEWTCDNKPFPHEPEIIEFPAVLVEGIFPFQALDEFQVYVRPEECQALTRFCTSLTAITQEMVDGGVVLKQAVERFHKWLLEHGLVSWASPWDQDGPADDAQGDSSLLSGGGDYWHQPGSSSAPPLSSSGEPGHHQHTGSSNSKRLSFAVVTWGDVDVMTTLRNQLNRLGLPMPVYFTYWINLKALFKRHYKRDPTGGLKRVVEGCGLTFEGRAHSGLVDSQNTAKIAQQMMRQGFQFTRATRGLDSNGRPYGGKQQQQQRRSADGPSM